MAPPWRASTRKDLQFITRKPFARKGHAFIAPAPVANLNFSRADLTLSMAMTSALSGATTSLKNSLNSAMAQFVTDHVDDVAPQYLQFLDTVDLLADSTRTYFSSCIGAGFADLYATKLGYRFRCNSRELKLPLGRVGDFLYDGRGVPAGSAVMVEAKGSLRINFSSRTFKNMVEGGYTGQVRRHVGKTYATNNRGSSLNIVHGYAVGCGGGISAKNPLPAIGHVAETAPSGGGGGGGGGSGARGSGSGGSTRPSQPSRSRGNATVVLGNFRAVATLLGTPDLLDLIDRARIGERVHLERLPGSLERVPFREQAFLQARNPPGGNRLRFAIWQPMLESLLTNLANDGDEWEMPDVPDALFGAQYADGVQGALQADGLALLPQQYDDEEIATSVRYLPPEPADRNREEEIMTVIRYLTDREGLVISDDARQPALPVGEKVTR